MAIRRDDDVPPDLVDTGPAVHALRRLDLSSSASLLLVTLLLLPISFVYASLLAFPLGRARTPIVIAFLVSGLVLFVRPIEAKFMRMFFKVQPPTAQQLQRLQPVWSSVLTTANVQGAKYVLAIDSSANPNASAIGGHVVAVTAGAINLPDDELAGILAHELGHHLGFHPYALSISWWLSLPLIVVGRIADFLISVSVRAAIAGWWLRLPLMTLFMSVVGLLFSLLGRVLRMVLWITALLITLIGRASEYTADHAAVQLGFGPGLRAALESFVSDDPAHRSSTLGQWLWASHPPLHKRITRINRALAAQGD